MSQNVAQKLIASHLVSGSMTPGDEIALRVDQTLTQDATGTMVMLELEALGLDRARTEVSVQYVDHNLLQTDSKNAEDHEFLRSACQRFGLWYSKAGNGVSHPTHMQRFGIPGKTMAGSDSRCSEAGGLMPAERCTMLIESSTVTPCGPAAWMSISVRPRHGRISASRPWTMWLRFNFVVTCTVSSHWRRAFHVS